MKDHKCEADLNIITHSSASLLCPCINAFRKMESAVSQWLARRVWVRQFVQAQGSMASFYILGLLTPKE